jgi:hypothetical protein
VGLLCLHRAVTYLRDETRVILLGHVETVSGGMLRKKASIHPEVQHA